MTAPLPASVTTVTVTGTYVQQTGAAAGQPGSGQIRFTPSVDLSVPTDGVMLPARSVVAQLDEDGAFSVVLLATDDVDLSSTGWVYHVEELISGGGVRRYDIELPASLGPTVDIAEIAPAVTAPAVVTYALAADLVAETEAREAADLLRLLLAGGTITGNLTIEASGAGKSYRFRTNGGSLDNEAAGADWYVSVWSGAGFAGSQRTYLRMESGAPILHAVNRWVFVPAASDGVGANAVLDVDPAGAAIGFFGTSATTKPTVSGSRASGAALTSLLTALASLGLITNSTSA